MAESPRVEFNTIPTKNSDVSLRGARIMMETGGMSIQPNNGRYGGDLEMIELDNEGHVVGEPLITDAGPGDIEEVADMIARWIGAGHSPREILSQLTADQVEEGMKIFEKWRERFGK